MTKKDYAGIVVDIVFKMLEGIYAFCFGLYVISIADRLFKSDLDQAYDSIIKENYGGDMSEEENFIRIAVTEDKAYWVVNNVLYETDIVDGEIDREASRPYDAMDKPLKEVAVMMDMLDSLKMTGERNEGSSTGDEGVPEL